jgi:hypothetical protein|tara:strand:+ start:157 stop:348 length:192 start_codon:yes stop_codon:yes gene_type:complete
VKHASFLVCDEVDAEVQSLANSLEHGNKSAMYRRICNGIMRQEFDIHLKALEKLIRQKEQPCK